jgi:catechol 2,3-dioxygenase-like lactoylglutathione lyase family enzyme
MIDHTGLQVADLSRSKRFYDPVLATLGHVPRRDLGDAVGYGKATPGPFDDPAGEFWLIEGTPLEPRIHIAFRAHSRESVDAFHRAALAAGGTDNGAPGIRLSRARGLKVAARQHVEFNGHEKQQAATQKNTLCRLSIW